MDPLDAMNATVWMAAFVAATVLLNWRFKVMTKRLEDRMASSLEASLVKEA